MMTDRELRETQFGAAIRTGESVGLKFAFASQWPGGVFAWKCGELPRDHKDPSQEAEKRIVDGLTFSRDRGNTNWHVSGFDSSDMGAILIMVDESNQPQAS